jgi:hypothetical protein
MSKQLTTYSGLDVNFAMNAALVGPIQAAGVKQTGINQVTVRMGVDQSVLQNGMDGSVVPSVVAGDQGEIDIQVWQTSVIHQQLLAWYNALRAARDAGDVSEWFGSSMIITSISEGTSHIATGVAPKKVPDKTYGTQAQTVTWTLVACNISNE